MKRSFYYIGVAAVQSLGSVGGPLIAARLMGPAQLGVLAVGLLVIVLVRAFASLGLYGPISVDLHEGIDGVSRGRRLLRWSGWFALPLATAFSGAGMVVPGQVGTYLSAAGAGTAAAVALGHQALHRSVTNHRAYATSVLGPTAYAHLGGVVALWLVSGGARTYLGAMAFVSVLSAAGLHWRHVARAGAVTRRELTSALRIGAPLIVTASATVALSLGDRPIIRAVFDEAAVGRYHLTYIIAGGGVPLLAALNNSWLPMVLNKPEAERLPSLGRSITGVVKGTSVLSLGALVIAPALVNVIGGPEYLTANTRWMALAIAVAVVPFAVYSGMSIGLLSRADTRAIAASTVTAAAVNLVANVALLPTLGLVGGGLASLLGYGCAAWVAWRRVGANLSWITPGVVATILAVLAAGMLSCLVPVDGIVMTVGRLVAGAATGVAGCVIVARTLSGRRADE